MKAKVLSFLAAGCLLIAAARLLHVPEEAQAEVPEKYRETVHRGLEYLVKNQSKDGHWEGDAGKHPVAMTGLVGIALLMEQDRPSQNARRNLNRPDGPLKYAANIRKAADWLLEQSRPERDGLIFSDHPSETTRYMQGHGLATMFLAGVSQAETDDARRKKLTEVLARAAKYIVKAQSTQGGWHDTSKAEGHDFASIPASVIQIQALQATQAFGFPDGHGESPAAQDGNAYMKTAIEKGGTPSDMAAALACVQGQDFQGFAVENKKNPLHENWFEACRAKIPVARDLKIGRDELVHYWYAQAEHRHGGDAWTAYRTAMFDRLQETQNKDGSWPAGDGLGVGSVYSTAVWCTVLQFDNGSHPTTQRRLLVVE